jgi:hypothetical protein
MAYDNFRDNHRVGDRVPIYGSIYEAHGFCLGEMRGPSGCGCNLPIFKH